MPEARQIRGLIPARVIDSFRSALSLSNEKLDSVARWFSNHREFLTDREIEPSIFERAAEELGISQSELAGTVSLIMTFLVAQKPSGELDADYIREAGLADQEPHIRRLLSLVDIPSSEVEYSRQKGLALQSAIPTLDDVDVLCDLRVVFRRFPSATRSQEHIQDVKALLGLEPVIIINLELNDSTGKDVPCLFQVSEGGLRNLIKTLQEGLEQLEIANDVKTKVFQK